jgi:hypothetical protein
MHVLSIQASAAEAHFEFFTRCATELTGLRQSVEEHRVQVRIQPVFFFFAFVVAKDFESGARCST